MQGKKYIAWLLIPFMFLFIFLNGYGHYFVHEFLSHEDTVHHNPSGTDYSYESEHTHCTILDFHLTESDTASFLLIKKVRLYSIKNQIDKSLALFSTLSFHFHLRAPPIKQI